MKPQLTTLFALLLIGCSTASSDVATDTDSALASSPESEVAASEILPTNGAPELGRSDALVTISAFLDPSSDDFALELAPLLELAGDEEEDVRLVLHPSSNVSTSGIQAWKLLHVAAANDEFEEGIEFLLRWKETWRSGDPIALAISTGEWSAEDFEEHLETDAFRTSLSGNMALAEKSDHFSGTVFMNGLRVADPSKFRSQYIKTLAAAQALVADGVQRREIFARAVETNLRAAATLNIVDSDKVPIGDSAFLGGAAPNITVVGFMDLQCPYTARAWQTQKDLLADYPNEVRFVFKHLPLPFHRQAKDAAIAAEAARRQGKFKEFVDLTFVRQKEMRSDVDAFVTEIADSIGLDAQKFQRDRNDPEILAHVEADMALAKELGANGTPNFWVNGVAITGAQPLVKFQEVVKRERSIISGLLAAETTDARNVYADRVDANFEKEKPAAESQPSKEPVARLVKINSVDASKGPPNAPVTVVIFSDFECPFCSRAVPTLEAVEKKYGKDVRFVFKHLPLPFHKNAKKMAYAAIAAGNQGNFWEMHDLIFENQKAFKTGADAEAERLATKLKLDMKRFKKDYSASATADQVDVDIKESTRVGARGTPNFFINGTKLTGARPLADFERVIDAELKLAESLRKKGIKPADIYEKSVEAKKNAGINNEVDADVKF